MSFKKIRYFEEVTIVDINRERDKTIKKFIADGFTITKLEPKRTGRFTTDSDKFKIVGKREVLRSEIPE